MAERRSSWRDLSRALDLLFAVLPLYWMVNMSFKTNTEILNGLTLWPATSRSSTIAPSSPIRPGIRATSIR